MDEALLRQLVRQLKILNIWISIAGTLTLVAFAIIIFLLFKVVTFVQDTSDKISSLEQKTQNTLNVQKQLCDNNSISQFLQNKSDLCK